VVPSDRTRGNRHKLKPRKFQLNMRKNFFTLRVMKHWNRLPRGAVESPSLEITESQNVQGWKGPLWVTQSNPLLKQGHPEQAAQDCIQVGLEYLQSPDAQDSSK